MLLPCSPTIPSSGLPGGIHQSIPTTAKRCRIPTCSSLKAVATIRAAGCEVIGMLANFSYEFPISVKRFRDAGVRMIPLCTYSAMLDAAQDAHYIRPEDMATLQEWRRDPANWVLNR